MKNFISTNKKGETKLGLPISRNKIVHQENNNILGEIIVSLFSCFYNPITGEGGGSDLQTTITILSHWSVFFDSLIFKKNMSSNR